MKPIYATLLPALFLTAITAACVPKPRDRTPPPTVTAPPPVATPLPPPPPANWMDAPQTAGDWRYESQQAAAIFADGATPRLTLRCDRAARRITLSRPVPTPGTGPGRMTIRTETQSRQLPANLASGQLSASLPAGDRLLDAMALSKGRFAVETPGGPALFLPSWAEVTRVIEDCR